MYLLDTDILIWIIRGNKKIITCIDKFVDKSVSYISVISIAEIYKNIFSSEILKTDEVIYNHAILSLDDQTAKQAGLYWRDYSRPLKTLSITDCMIAATAKIHDLKLVTLNTRHFPMTDIIVQNPLKLKS